MKLVTTEVVATMPIVEIKGAIFSEQVISVNMVKDTISGFRGLFGGKLDSYSTEYRKGREAVIEELCHHSRDLEANGIVDLNVNYNQFINSDVMLIVVTGSGTAVTVMEATQ